MPNSFLSRSARNGPTPFRYSMELLSMELSDRMTVICTNVSRQENYAAFNSE